MDIKVFIKNCCDTDKLKFSTEYKNKHFDLESNSESQIKLGLLRILEKRCGTKPDELGSFFEKVVENVDISDEKQDLLSKVKQEV